jgi:PAS domain S-box-containing protein
LIQDGDHLEALVQERTAQLRQAIEELRREVADRKRAERVIKALQRFLEIANRHTQMGPLLDDFLMEVRSLTGCDSVGIRMLDDHGNIPYEAYKGFSRAFYGLESPLSIHSDQCMCINVIKGDTDESLPFYTGGGSFYMNGTTRFLSTVSPEEKGSTRNACNEFGYESVALVPIRVDDRILGLIHVADHKENRVPEEMVELLERVAMQVGTAVQRVRTEDALQESMERFDLAVRGANDGLWDWWPATDQSWVSPRFKQLLGYGEDDDLGNPIEFWRTRLHPDDHDRVMQALRDHLEQRVAYDIEYRLRTRDGQWRWFVARGQALWNAEGQAVRMAGSLRDITKLKRTEEELRKHRDHLEEVAEERAGVLGKVNEQLQGEIAGREQAKVALEESEQRFRALAETTSDWVWEVDQNGVYTYANPKLKDLLGYEPAEIIGKTPFDLMPADEAERVGAAFREIVKSGEPFAQLENTNLHKDGRRVVLETSGVPILDAGGNLLGYRGIDRDITERKHAERKIAETLAELSRSNAELEQFAHIASHDLQEPLRMVASFVDLLAQRYKGQLDDDADEFIEFAVDGAKRMQRMINDLLSYSRLGTRRKPLEPTDFNLVIDEVIKNLRVLISEQGAVVTHDELPTVKGDRTQLVQLVQNLLGNAIRFRGKEPPRIHVSAKKSGPERVFSVQDNGIGIDAKYRDRVFAVFQRLHNRNEYPGTGIGLAICRRIVDRHGGRIWFDSEPGKGTTFYFTLSQEGAPA